MLYNVWFHFKCRFLLLYRCVKRAMECIVGIYSGLNTQIQFEWTIEIEIHIDTGNKINEFYDSNWKKNNIIRHVDDVIFKEITYVTLHYIVILMELGKCQWQIEWIVYQHWIWQMCRYFKMDGMLVICSNCTRKLRIKRWIPKFQPEIHSL